MRVLRRIAEALLYFPGETLDALLYLFVESGVGIVTVLVLLLIVVLLWARLELMR